MYFFLKNKLILIIERPREKFINYSQEIQETYPYCGVLSNQKTSKEDLKLLLNESK